MGALERLIGPRTRLVAVTHVANATGALVPVEAIVRLAHAQGAKVLVDGCQAVPRLPVDVQALGCDFYAFSGHKIYGPTGIGVLYGTRGAARRDAAVAGRRRHDPYRDLREDRCSRSRRTGSRPARPTFPARSASARALEYIEALGRDAIAAHEAAADGLRRRPAVAHARRAPRRRRGSAASASCPSTSTACIRTISAPCSTSMASRCAPATTAPSR